MTLEQSKATTTVSLSVTTEQSSLSRIVISKHSDSKNREENCDSKCYRAIHGITSNEVGKQKKNVTSRLVSHPVTTSGKTGDELYNASTDQKPCSNLTATESA